MTKLTQSGERKWDKVIENMKKNWKKYFKLSFSCLIFNLFYFIKKNLMIEKLTAKLNSKKVKVQNF